MILAPACADAHAAPDAYLGPDAYLAADAGPDHAEALAVYDQMFDAECAAAVRCSRPDTFGADYARQVCAPARRARGEAAIQAGYWTVDVALAQRCVDGVATMQCVLSDTPAYVSLGELPSDDWALDYLQAYCELAVETVPTCGVPAVVCGPAQRCATDAGCTEACVAAVPEGGACAGSGDCATGLRCESGACVPITLEPSCTPARCRAAGLGHDWFRRCLH